MDSHISKSEGAVSDIDIFLNAPADASREDLASYLDGACGGDADLRARVEALFEADGIQLGVLDRAPEMPRDSASPDDGALIEAEGSSIGPYKLLQNIGEGGFGSVYMAEQLRPV